MPPGAPEPPRALARVPPNPSPGTPAPDGGAPAKPPVPGERPAPVPVPAPGRLPLPPASGSLTGPPARPPDRRPVSPADPPDPLNAPAGPAAASNELPAYWVSSTDIAQVAGAATITATAAIMVATVSRPPIRGRARPGSRPSTSAATTPMPATTVAHSAHGRKVGYADHR